MLFVRGLEVASIGVVANQRLIAATQAGLQAAQHGGAHLGIAFGFGEIATDDVAPLTDLLGLEFGIGTPGPWDDERNARFGIVQHDFVHFLGRVARAPPECIRARAARGRR
jgi:hypothetical protein